MSTITYAYNRFCIKRFPLPRERQFDDLEWRINVQFPASYRQFILEFNGGYFNDCGISSPDPQCPDDGLRALAGIGASHLEAELGSLSDLSLFDDNTPAEIMVIGRTTCAGLIIMRVRYEDIGSIYLKQAYGGFYYLADDIGEFFGLLHDDVE